MNLNFRIKLQWSQYALGVQYTRSVNFTIYAHKTMKQINIWIHKKTLL